MIQRIVAVGRCRVGIHLGDVFLRIVSVRVEAVVGHVACRVVAVAADLIGRSCEAQRRRISTVQGCLAPAVAVNVGLTGASLYPKDGCEGDSGAQRNTYSKEY